MTLPNVILLTIDCLRYDHCGFNGHARETTPTLDRLAQEATVFDAAVAPGPRTSESIPGILAGLLSADCAFYDEIAYKAVPSDTPTMASWLSDRDYHTVAAVANPQLSPVRNFDRGFGTFDNLRIEDNGDRFESDGEAGGDTGGLESRLVDLRGRLRDPIRERLRKRGPSLSDPATLAFLFERIVRKRSGWPTVPGADVIDRLLTMLDTTPDDAPVFAWTHLNDLHAPLHPGRVREGGLLGAPSDLTQFRCDLARVANQYEPNYAAMYASTLRYVDAQVARLVDYLRTNGMWDETVLIVTADHGEALHDRGVYGHAAGQDRYTFDPKRDYMFEELLHVPLLVRDPGGEGRRIRFPMSLTWLHELVAEIAGLEPGEFPQKSGRKSNLDPETDALVVADAISEEGHTIVTRHRRLKRISECAGGERGSLDGAPLVFNLDVDPGERTNLAGSKPTPALADAAEEVFTPPNRLRPLDGEIDAETRELLGQLGYR